MIDLAIVARMWSAYGVNIIVLIILLFVAWVMGLVIRRSQVKGKEGSRKG
jgi:Na+-transporting methylmalonyl-CoA/oxaloacetate decarboxylase gamma subunit